jgi:hypothetical protein
MSLQQYKDIDVEQKCFYEEFMLLATIKHAYVLSNIFV